MVTITNLDNPGTQDEVEPSVEPMNAVQQQQQQQRAMATTTAVTTTGQPRGASGANAELLISMMNCVDTSLFSPQQLQNWEQMKGRIRLAAEQNLPLVLPADVAAIKTAVSEAAGSAPANTSATSAAVNGSDNVDYRQPLRREASIQDVLSCLLDQQAPSGRVVNSSGGNVLLNSEMKNRSSPPSEAPRPTLKSLLSSNNFTMTEKKESLKHLLSFIDNSFASHPEPMTDVYKESQEGNLRRLSSLQLMRSFIMPNPSAQSMGRTTSFEIIQAMLNATSNQVIQKPMTSQDSFRFQHLASCIEAIEGDVGYDNEDYGGEEVVQVDNLDNLLDYHSPPQPQPVNGPHSGFVDTQSLLNSSTRASAPMPATYNPNEQYANNGYQSYPTMNAGGAPMYGSQLPQYSTLGQPGMGMMGSMPGAGMYGTQGMPPTKVEPSAAQQHQHQVMLNQDLSGQYGQMSFQSAMLAATTPGMMLGSSYHDPQSGHMKPSALQHQQLNAILMQQQQQQQHAILQASAQVKQQKQDAQGGVQICSALGCNHVARVKGMCKLHGGGRRCKVEGCMKSAQTGHLCIAHGGGKPCNVEGCPKTAQSRGLCKQHGGGVRCKFEGCTKSCQSGGYCRGHGGGKRCEFPNCTKWAQKNGHCAKHAQEVAQQMQQQQQALHP